MSRNNYHHQGMLLRDQIFRLTEWKDALIYNKTPRDPNGKDWKRSKKILQIKWTSNKPALDEVIQICTCNYIKT